MRKIIQKMATAVFALVLMSCHRADVNPESVVWWNNLGCEDCTVGDAVEGMKSDLSMALLSHELYLLMAGEHEWDGDTLIDNDGRVYKKYRKIDFARDIWYCTQTGDFVKRYWRKGERILEKMCPYTWRRDSLALVDSIKKATGWYDPVRSFFRDTFKTRYGVLTPAVMDSLYDNSGVFLLEGSNGKLYQLAFQIANIDDVDIFYYDPFHDVYLHEIGIYGEGDAHLINGYDINNRDQDSTEMVERYRQEKNLPDTMCYLRTVLIGRMWNFHGK